MAEINGKTWLFELHKLLKLQCIIYISDFILLNILSHSRNVTMLLN